MQTTGLVFLDRLFFWLEKAGFLEWWGIGVEVCCRIWRDVRAWSLAGLCVWRLCGKTVGVFREVGIDVSHMVVSFLWRFGIATDACSLILYFLTVSSEG